MRDGAQGVLRGAAQRRRHAERRPHREDQGLRRVGPRREYPVNELLRRALDQGRGPAVALAIALAGAALAWHLMPMPEPPSTLAFPAGREHVYALAWKTATESRAMSAATATP